MKGFLIAAAVIAVMVMIVPLIVWAGSGSLSHAWYALKSYLKIMATIVAVGALLGLAVWLGGMQ